jgi:hypothetical protein
LTKDASGAASRCFKVVGVDLNHSDEKNTLFRRKGNFIRIVNDRPEIFFGIIDDSFAARSLFVSTYLIIVEQINKALSGNVD